jgi:hypothetical protein
MESAASADRDRTGQKMMRGLFFLFFMGFALSLAAQSESVDAIKQRVEHASPADQVRLCLHVAQAQLQHASDFYKSNDNANARRALQDVETYGVRAAKISAESGKHQKDAEIAVRKISYRLGELARDADLDERPPIKAVMTNIDKAHDDLLASMFKK